MCDFFIFCLPSCQSQLGPIMRLECREAAQPPDLRNSVRLSARLLQNDMTEETSFRAKSGCEAAEVKGQQAPISLSTNVPVNSLCASL